MIDSAEMARRGRIAAAKGVLKANSERAAAVNRGNKERGRKISESLRNTLSAPEARKRRAILAKEQWKRPGMREKMIHGIIEQMKDCQSRKYRDTVPELVVKELLETKGIAYIAQKPMFGTLWDFVIPGAKVIIEVDGCYWHSCPVHHPNRDPKRIETDAKRTQRAEAAGWRVLRVWEHGLVNRKAS